MYVAMSQNPLLGNTVIVLYTWLWLIPYVQYILVYMSIVLCEEVSVNLWLYSYCVAIASKHVH